MIKLGQKILNIDMALTMKRRKQILVLTQDEISNMAHTFFRNTLGLSWGMVLGLACEIMHGAIISLYTIYTMVLQFD